MTFPKVLKKLGLEHFESQDHILTVDYGLIDDAELKSLARWFHRCNEEFADHEDLSEFFLILQKELEGQIRSRNYGGGKAVKSIDLNDILRAMDVPALLTIRGLAIKMSLKSSSRRFFGESLARLFDENRDELLI